MEESPGATEEREAVRQGESPQRATDVWRIRLNLIKNNLEGTLQKRQSGIGSTHELKTINKLFIEETHKFLHKLNPMEVSEYTDLQMKVELHCSRSTTNEPVSVPVRTKLPKLEMPRFDGNVLKWKEFWDRFSSSIDNQPLDKANKLAYLQMALKGEALNTIRGLDATNDNYTVAVELLKERYGKPGRVLDAHYVALTNLKCASVTAKDYLDTFDNIERHLRVLEAMGEDINHNHFRSLILSKFPDQLIHELRTRIIPEEENVMTIRKQLEHLIMAKTPSHIESLPVSTIETLHVRSEKIEEAKRKRPYITKARHQPSRENKKMKIDPCVFCGGNHFNDQCTKPVQERKSLVKDRCFKCLRKGHRAKQCRQKKRCYHCKDSSHNSALCLKKHSKLGTTTLQVKDKRSTRVLLQTAIIKLRRKDTGEEVNCRLLFDTGSQRSYISTKAAKRLNLKPTGHDNLTIYTFGSFRPIEVQSPSANLEIEGINITLNVMSHITENVDHPGLDVIKTLLEMGKRPADDGSLGKGIDILIGNDYYHALIYGKRVPFKNQLYLVESAFGWILSGVKEEDDRKETDDLSVMTYMHSEKTKPKMHAVDLPLSNLILPKLWDLETIGIFDCPKATRDDQAVDNFNKTVKFNHDRYWIRWLWSTDPTDLSDNYGLAWGRLVALVKRTDRKTLQIYDSTLKEQQRAGIIEEVGQTHASDQVIHYLPHHGVKKNGKLRIVYDASSKTRGKKSLNECLYTGPLLLEDLIALLLRFRTHKYGIMADVEKAFLQIGIQIPDRDVTRFLWIKNINEPLSSSNLLHFRFCRVPFGIVCSPFMLAIVLRHHLSQMDSPICNKVSRDIYVDNIVSGAAVPEECLDFYKRVSEAFKTLSMNLRDWYSNNAKLMSEVKEDRHGKTADGANCLGMIWDTQRDKLSLKQSPRSISTIMTKREVLKQLASIYDPCGFISPLLVQPKLYLQNLWKIKLDWDTPIPTELLKEWDEIVEYLKQIDTIEIPRWYGLEHPLEGTASRQELHCFSDASMNAYAAAVYLKVTQGKTTKTTLIMSKSRLAPIKDKPYHTIPRMELLGVLIGCRLLTYVKKALQINIENQYLWTDSQIILCWIKSNRVLPPFVAARVKELHKFEDVTFRYIASEMNPADIATRPCSKISDTTWFQGPSLLKEDCSKWPELPKKGEHVMLVNTDPENLEIIKELQKRYFPSEVDGKTTNLTRTLGLYKEEDVLRCKGRFKMADWPVDQKYPILLPKDTPFTRKIIEDTHKKLYHVGVGQTLANIRRFYWIPCGRSQVQKVLRRCYECRKYGGGPYKNPPIGPLPKERVNIAAPFTYTGTDYLGPLYVITKDNTFEKRWVCLYTCLAVRAIHLEVTENLSAEECLLAMRRFIATRGKPHMVLSDNGTHYKLTSEVMGNDYLTNEGVKWKFIPELAPWWGGVYERLVGLVKHCLKRTIDKHTLNDRQLITIVKEIEAVLNDRPLTASGQEVEHVLTPNNFLRAGGLSISTELTEENLLRGTETKNNLVEGWRRGQSILEEFKKMFTNQYLYSLRERMQQSKNPRIVEKKEPRVGDIVQIGEKGCRVNWEVGRIESLSESSDGQIRVAVVKLSGGKRLRRSITQLYPLEIEDEEEREQGISDQKDKETQQDVQQKNNEEGEKGLNAGAENGQFNKRTAAQRASILIKEWTKELAK